MNWRNDFGLALRAGRLALGDRPSTDALHHRRAHLLLLASDAGDSIKRKMERLSETYGVPLRRPVTKRELGALCGRDTCSVVAVKDRGLAGKLLAGLSGAGRLGDRRDRLEQEHTSLPTGQGTGRRKQGTAPPAERRDEN